MARDYYEVLGVQPNASQDEIQAAYRRLSRAHHPDVNKDPGAEERFKEVGQAYSVLSDQQSRARYDAERSAAAFGGFGGRARAGAGGGPAGGRGPGRRGTGRRGRRRTTVEDEDLGGIDFGGIDIEDLFGDLFGARGAPGPIPGADQEAELVLTVEEAYQGGRRSVSLAGPEGERGYEVNIPAGVTSGQRIRLAGQGGRGSGDAPAGDLYLVVRIAEHPRYRLEHRDLHVDLPVSPWEAALGATVPVDTPGGEVKVQVPPGSSSGRRLRLSGQGMPNPRGRPGDLYAEVRIMVPRSLSARDRELFEKLSHDSSFDPRRGG
jgi:curved DNA-binding protein